MMMEKDKTHNSDKHKCGAGKTKKTPDDNQDSSNLVSYDTSFGVDAGFHLAENANYTILQPTLLPSHNQKSISSGRHC